MLLEGSEDEDGGEYADHVAPFRGSYLPGRPDVERIVESMSSRACVALAREPGDFVERDLRVFLLRVGEVKKTFASRATSGFDGAVGWSWKGKGRTGTSDGCDGEGVVICFVERVRSETGDQGKEETEEKGGRRERPGRGARARLVRGAPVHLSQAACHRFLEEGGCVCHPSTRQQTDCHSEICSTARCMMRWLPAECPLEVSTRSHLDAPGPGHWHTALQVGGVSLVP